MRPLWARGMRLLSDAPEVSGEEQSPSCPQHDWTPWLAGSLTVLFIPESSPSCQNLTTLGHSEDPEACGKCSGGLLVLGSCSREYFSPYAGSREKLLCYH